MTYSSTEEFNHLMDYLARQLGLPELDKSGDNVRTIAAEDMAVSFINQSGTLILATNLANQPDEGLSMALKNALLRANVLYSGTMGGCLGVTPEGVVSFCYQYPLEGLPGEKFITILEGFLAAAKIWTDRLAEMAAGFPAPELEAPAETENWVKI